MDTMGTTAPSNDYTLVVIVLYVGVLGVLWVLVVVLVMVIPYTSGGTVVVMVPD